MNILFVIFLFNFKILGPLLFVFISSVIITVFIFRLSQRHSRQGCAIGFRVEIEFFAEFCLKLEALRVLRGPIETGFFPICWFLVTLVDFRNSISPSSLRIDSSNSREKKNARLYCLMHDLFFFFVVENLNVGLPSKFGLVRRGDCCLCL